VCERESARAREGETARGQTDRESIPCRVGARANALRLAQTLTQLAAYYVVTPPRYQRNCQKHACRGGGGGRERERERESMGWCVCVRESKAAYLRQVTQCMVHLI
jgi:hypothetical protein